MTKWQVKDAKSRLSELIEAAEREGPQVITRYGKDAAVVVSAEAYRKLDAAQPDFKAYLLSGPKLADFEIHRPRDLGRDVEL